MLHRRGDIHTREYLDLRRSTHVYVDTVMLTQHRSLTTHPLGALSVNKHKGVQTPNGYTVSTSTLSSYRWYNGKSLLFACAYWSCIGRSTAACCFHRPKSRSIPALLSGLSAPRGHELDGRGPQQATPHSSLRSVITGGTPEQASAHHCQTAGSRNSSQR